MFCSYTKNFAVYEPQSYKKIPNIDCQHLALYHPNF